MPSSVRPKGSGGGSRAPPVTPMSERQQMALLMQMTSSNESGSRSPSSGSRTRDRNERGWTPLHEACNHGWYEVAFRLLQAGANVNAKGLDNDTPLHDAVINGHLKLVKLLVEKGADINAKNSKGKTPLDVAVASVQPYLLNPGLPLPESGGGSLRVQPRTRDDKKVAGVPSSSSSDSKQKTGGADSMDVKAGAGSASGTTATAPDDVYEFKSVKDGDSSPEKCSEGDGEATDPLSLSASEEAAGAASKRPYADYEGGEDSSIDEDNKRKKRKEEGAKPVQRSSGQGKGQGGKQSVSGQGKSAGSATKSGGPSAGAGAAVAASSGDKKSPCPSPKPTTVTGGGGGATSDAELEGGGGAGGPDGKTSDLKVPPLKIVIPQGSGGEQETGACRNGKSSSQRSHQALPYVVPSSGAEAADKDAPPTSPEGGAAGSKDTDKKETSGGQPEDQRAGSGQQHQRVLRSSQRAGPSSGDSSPPSPPTGASEPSTEVGGASGTACAVVESQANPTAETEPAAGAAAAAIAAPPPAPVELHPRKRKLKQNKEQSAAQQQQQQQSQEAGDASSESREVHPHDQPITNCYRLFLNIRKQIEKRRKGLFPVQPKPPQGFKDYLMNRCTYVLAGTAPTSPNVTYPANLPAQLKDLFMEQEKERYKLRMQHVIEKEKLVLSVEQEILRAHGRAARALAEQSLPFSVCTILRDEEVYNLITPEQEEKDRNTRSRYNGRLFLSWLQDVDDKWEKIKEHMLLRHHNEAESLHAVQKMNWEWKLKEHSLCDRKTTPKIDELHVPMVHVSDDFDLLPA
ncbi:ankyrin repeat domain-containing protein 11 isoform X2 [Cylas formicarius]|uniref:ankyrin repeat domain-containing protein 11 isoform X2 n=1 Tax=Cylas formicarius TaxID=197179 RepID=UPI002958B457|nr:ankyrin repeat domain-containing protein 11 isoform X2 [Cylas formicarius]